MATPPRLFPQPPVSLATVTATGSALIQAAPYPAGAVPGAVVGFSPPAHFPIVGQIPIPIATAMPASQANQPTANQVRGYICISQLGAFTYLSAYPGRVDNRNCQSGTYIVSANLRRVCNFISQSKACTHEQGSWMHTVNGA